MNHSLPFFLTMALTFNDGQRNEFFIILNLFKTNDSKIHDLAYELLLKRLSEMTEQTLNHKYLHQFIEDLMRYFQTVDKIPGKADCYIYNLFASVIQDNKRAIELMKGEMFKRNIELEALRKINAALETELDSLRKKDAEKI